MPAPDFSMKNWTTGQPMTLLQAFGFSKAKFTVPKLMPQLPSASANAASAGANAAANAVSTGGVPAVQKGKLQNYARQVLTSNNWTGSGQWSAFNSIEMAEAGWNPRIKNPSSGALGIAQALGHGNSNTQGTLGNEYGGYGLTDRQAREANSGNGYWQLVWMANYIKAVYGTPSAAWQFHQANNWY